MYSRYNEGKSVVAERFIRTFKKQDFKANNSCFKKCLFWCVRRYTIHKTIKMKPIDVTSDSYAEYNEDSNEKDPEFKVGYHVNISKYKNIFAKGYTQNWSEEMFVVSKIKNTVPWTYVISDLNDVKIAGNFYQKELQKN